MAEDPVPELPVPPGWRKIGTFTTLETSLGTFGPGDLILPEPGGSADDD